jgi:hypothetical protein
MVCTDSLQPASSLLCALSLECAEPPPRRRPWDGSRRSASTNPVQRRPDHPGSVRGRDRCLRHLPPDPLPSSPRHAGADRPLRPGDKVRLFVRQAGPARFEAFKVSLLCEERGQKGTRRAHSHQLVNRKSVDIAPANDLTRVAHARDPRGRAGQREGVADDHHVEDRRPSEGEVW